MPKHQDTFQDLILFAAKKNIFKQTRNNLETFSKGWAM